VAARGARTAIGDAGDRISQQPIAWRVRGCGCRLSPRTARNWVCRGQEPRDRFPGGRMAATTACRRRPLRLVDNRSPSAISATSVAVIDTRPIVTTYETNAGKTRAVPLTGDYPCVSRCTSARVISSMRRHTKVQGLPGSGSGARAASGASGADVNARR